VKVTKDKIENRQAYLTIEMESPEVEEGLKKAYNRLVQKAKIPGFRKGKTPRPILEQYLGKSALLEDAVEHMAPEAFEKAAKEQDLKPIARPEIQLEKVEPVTYKVVVALEPIIKLGDYHQVKMAPEAVQLKEEDLNKAIENLRHQHAIWEPVDRQVNSHDTVIMDIASQVGDQPYINQNDAEFEVVKESEYPMKGFPEELLGMKKGETKEFKLSFPADYNRAELAGKEVSFKVTMKEIKQERLPEINDDFAAQVNPDFKTLDDLKNKIKENLKQIAEEKAKRDFEQKVINEVVKISEVEYPAVMEEQEIDNLIQQQMQRWQMDEKGLDQYLQSIQKTPEQLREEMRPPASKSIKQSLVLTEVARTENVQIEKADLEKEIQNMTRDLPTERRGKILEILNMPQSQVNIASTIATRKTLEILTAMAQSPAAEAQTAAGAAPAESKSAETETEEMKLKEKKSRKKEAQEC
jgi:trigger factor